MERHLLLIACVSAVCVSSQRLFYFFYDVKNWTEAMASCRLSHTDLVSVDHMEDMKVLTNLAKLSQMVDHKDPQYSSRAWIGLHNDRVSRWRWSLSDRKFYKPDGTKFRNWAAGEPNNKGGIESCVWMYDNGEWNDESCETQLKPVCAQVKGQSVTFVRLSAAMRWSEAQRYCRQHHTDLASVRNMLDNQRVQNLVPPGEQVWIGLFNDSWNWIDGQDSSFRFWSEKTKEPNGNMGEELCVAANFEDSGKWEDWKCDWKRSFICYRDVQVSRQLVKLNLQKNSDLDLEDPAVMEDLLRKLKQKLKDSGVKGDIRLSWRKQADGKVFQKEVKRRRKKSRDEL